MTRFVKEPLIIKTDKGNNYLINFNKKQIIYLNPILAEFANIYLQQEIKNLEKCKELVLNKKKSSLAIEYYFEKFKFLSNAGFFDNYEIIISPITDDVINKTISETTHIVFEVTEKCNLKCKYCGYGDLYVEKQSENKNIDLDIELAKNIINEVINHTIKSIVPLFSISFYGGEPLIKIDFIKTIVHYCKSKWPSQDFEFRMTTNAILLNKYMDYLVEENFNLLISLDGNEKHNQFRTYKNNKKSFKKVFDNISLLKERYPNYFDKKVEFNSVINTESNTNKVKQFFLKEFNKAPHLTQELTYVGLDPEKMKEFNKILNTYTLDVKDTPYYFRRKFIHRYEDYNELYEKDEKKKKQYFVNHPFATCLPFQVKLFVSATGEIRNCEKIGMSLSLDKLSNEKKEFDSKKITETFRSFQKNSNKVCSSCYNYDCKDCILIYTNKNGEFKCHNYLSKELEIKKISAQYSIIEQNPSSLFLEPPIK
ncbi:MAG: radical SAM protein [Bacteroidales bacterium]|nr:radical SAM protein [Bacteroidales bacterium]